MVGAQELCVYTAHAYIIARKQTVKLCITTTRVSTTLQILYLQSSSNISLRTFQTQNMLYLINIRVKRDLWPVFKPTHLAWDR